MRMRPTLISLLLYAALPVSAQEASGAMQFWQRLQKLCGLAFEGRVTLGATADFEGKRLVMEVRSCGGNRIRIPLHVGDNRSRTWVLSYEQDGILLKHDHRHEDGSEDRVTQYGGRTSNAGLPHIQFFPADRQTAELLPQASTNVWWITVDEDSFTYNLRRIGSDRLFTATFDLTRPVANPPAPWGWRD